MMRNKNIIKAVTLASAFAFGLAAFPHTVIAGEEAAQRGSTSESTTSRADRQAGKKPNSSSTRQSGSSNAAPDEWEKAKGLGQKKKGEGSSGGGDTGMGSSSSQGSSTSGTSSGSGGY